MSIKATGTILENPGDGRTVKVAWDPPAGPREWYMYTYQTTLESAEPKNEMSRKLIAFTFRGEKQDLDFWLAQKYWADKYGEPSPDLEEPFDGEEDDEIEEAGEDEAVLSYTAASIVEDGCFLAQEKIESILSRLESRKNLILQGPPGTGKTWLAKRLAYALIGHASTRAEERMRVVQFHPSLSYEDFVRGWRPSADGKLTLSDGLFLDAVNAAKSDPRPFVVVIEEINRGNPASIFGELLTLLEGDKRRSSEGITLAYTHPDRRTEKVYLPDNLYIIGTMNIADRSLALVDLALRRRFSFYTLEPEYNGAWMDWCIKQAKLEKEFISNIGDRVQVLNREIVSGVGEQFRIGHSYFTPVRGQTITDGKLWFRSIVETEVEPLLEEYFFEDTARAKKLSQQLLAGL
jgi:5-methylcytosine-specific restriction protein B